MLRRNSSRNKQRRPLSRSKSTSSIVRSSIHLLEAIDPVSAERDAHIAAVLSYNRAQSRHSQDMAGIPRDPASFSPDRSYGAPSSTGNGLGRSQSTRSRQGGSVSASEIRRQQSVRFAGPSAQPRRTLASRATEAPGPLNTPNPTFRILGNVDNRPTSSLSYSRKRPDPHAFTRRYLDSLQAPDECYTHEDDVDSVPSSYRRLRKSKSMFSASNPLKSGYSFHNGTPDQGDPQTVKASTAPLQKENNPPSADRGPRPSTSLSVLKSRRISASRSSSRAENDLAVQLAREKFREQVEEQSRLKPRPSMLFRSKDKRSESSIGFRKSLRNSSNNSTILSSSFSSHSLSIPKQPGLRKTARKVSRTLRTKLKGLFIRPKSAADPEAHPDDHNLYESDGESCLNLDDGMSHQEASMSRVPSHVPSLHAVPSNQEMRSRKGSVESINSGEQESQDDKSRVTSWTNSITNTTSSVCDWERQRLSIIKENGTHVPSLPRTANQQESMLQEKGHSPGLAVDSQRVYSALMKRADEAKRQAEALRNQSVQKMKAYGVEPERSSSGEGWAPSTIRCVQAHDDVFGGQAVDSMAQESSSSEEATDSPARIASALAAVTLESQPTAGTGKLPSLERRTLDPPTTLTHRSSAFFASPAYHLFRTTSPYRRALRESMNASEEQEAPDLTASKYLKSLSEISLPTRKNSSAGSDGDPRTTYAESVYSCATDDVQPAVPSNLSPAPPTFESHGDATIFVDAPVYKPTAQHQRDISTASSVDWKTWLSAKVSKLEVPTTSPKPHSESGTLDILPKLGHIREGAEIDSPRECSGLAKLDSIELTPRNPLSHVEGNVRSIPDVKMPRNISDKAAWPHDENEAPVAVYSPDWQDEWPPIPPRSRLRSIPPNPTTKGDSDTKAPELATEVPHIRSLNTIGHLNSPSNGAINKRRTRTRVTGWHGSPTKSSPGVSSTVEREFQSNSSESPAQRSEWTSSRSTPKSWRGSGRKNESFERTVSTGQEFDGEVGGSKKMVDMFLNSRRNRTYGNITGAEAGSSPAAFL
ncbi:hypothetical protein AK830_g11533 [Neonectria ditissima]|uniref:Uncharacterized protein n=1 Tax=Neonectria ditissima TaxID=78410 RepID=A0A0P7ACL0_9HYPO|nr:hypothetical protein AK830_g11533 [Neonectria ditissima]